MGGIPCPLHDPHCVKGATHVVEQRSCSLIYQLLLLPLSPLQGRQFSKRLQTLSGTFEGIGMGLSKWCLTRWTSIRAGLCQRVHRLIQVLIGNLVGPRTQLFGDLLELTTCILVSDQLVFYISTENVAQGRHRSINGGAHFC